MTIWTAWFQGRDAAPASVRAIFDLWERMNPDREVRVLTQADADAILARHGIRQPNLAPQITADLVRLILLAEEGGTWVDATLLPTRPLSDWLGDLQAPAGLFSFASSGDPNLVFQCWFISAEAGNPLIVRLAEDLADYFRTRRRYPNWKRALGHGAIPQFVEYRKRMAARDTLWFVDPEGGRANPFYPYAVINYSLARILDTEPEMRAIWDRVPFRTAFAPCAIHQLAEDRNNSDAMFLRHAADLLPLAPVHKLNHRDPRFADLVAIAGRACPAVRCGDHRTPLTGSTACRAG